MTRVSHVFDRDTGWEQRTSASILLERHAHMGFPGSALCLNPIARRKLAILESSAFAAGIDAPAPLVAPLLRRKLRANHSEIVHAWGWRAAAAAHAARSEHIVLTVFRPDVPDGVVARIRTMTEAGRLAVACSADRVRRRLVERGVPMEKTVVIRPGIDFAAINRFRKSRLRERLGLQDSDLFCVIADPSGSKDGLFDAFWAIRLFHLVYRKCRCLVLDDRDRDRLQMLDRVVTKPPALVTRPNDVSYEHAVAAADVLIVSPADDCSTSAMAWAMASETLVIASATYAATELIASGLNGLLFKRRPDRRSFYPIMTCLRNTEQAPRLKDVARGQAFEVFGVQRHAEQYRKLYQNVLAGRCADEGIVDPALTDQVA